MYVSVVLLSLQVTVAWQMNDDWRQLPLRSLVLLNLPVIRKIRTRGFVIRQKRQFLNFLMKEELWKTT